MSYILESLKRSDQERQQASAGDSALVANAIEFREDTPTERAHKRGLLIVLAIALLILAALFYHTWVDIKKLSADDSFHGEAVVLTEKSVDPPEVLRDTLDTSTPELSNEPPVPYVEEADSLERKVVELVELVEAPPVFSEPQGGASTESVDSDAVALYQQTDNNKQPGIDALYQQRKKIGADHAQHVSAKKADAQSLSQTPVSPDVVQAAEPTPLIPDIYDLDRVTQQSIPAIQYNAHIYATDNNSGFVILNGAKRKVGEKTRAGIYVEQVEKDAVILSYQGVVFSLPAMKNWTP